MTTKLSFHPSTRLAETRWKSAVAEMEKASRKLEKAQREFDVHRETERQRRRDFTSCLECESEEVQEEYYRSKAV